jgi:hypothetical protein
MTGESQVSQDCVGELKVTDLLTVKGYRHEIAGKGRRVGEVESLLRCVRALGDLRNLYVWATCTIISVNRSVVDSKLFFSDPDPIFVLVLDPGPDSDPL